MNSPRFTMISSSPRSSWNLVSPKIKMIEKPIHNCRAIALEILLLIEKERDITASELLSRVMEKESPEERDRGLIKELVFGALRHRLFLDHALNQYIKAKRPLQEELRQILRLGAYQLLFLSRIPPHAAVNESVSLAQSYLSRGAAGFANAILRKIALSSSWKDIPLPDRKKNPECYLSIRYSHPPWMVKTFLEQYGREKTEALLEKDNEPSPLALRVNLLKNNREQLMEWLKTHHPEAEITLGRYSPQALYVKKLSLTSDLPHIMEGEFYIQDEGAQLIGLLAHPGPCMRVIDFCSAPGGKITHIAELTGNRGELIALDTNKNRLRRVVENCKRLGVSPIRIEKITPPLLDELKKKGADLVLVDAPCSGTGILRRQPDIKWKKKKGDIAKLRERQLKILDQASQLVIPGGVLLYSTCSLLEQENQSVIREFLKSHSEYHIEDPVLSRFLIDASLITKEGFFVSFPPQSGMDGFFAARLVKER
ncbi:16S rRNA (cytosine(967)-C(5))-methyltransferase RsmB [Candidatus Sumerlaeota bacterium]|nr:16S rRNA (cytosine(967)-C(5))-methyltransferase RsmB [Candidatus Sumerlaeota bacterium]